MDFLFGDSGPYTDRHLMLLGEWSPLVQGIVLLIAAAVVVLTWYNYRDVRPRRRRALLLTLRTLIVLALVAVFYQPAFLEENISRSRNHVPVLLDVSESMGLPHGESTRARLAADFVRRHEDLWEALDEDNDLAFFAFGEDLEDLGDLHLADEDRLREATRPRGRQSRIVDALDAIRGRYRNRDLGGVVVVTDGVDTTPAGRRAALDPASKSLLRDLDAPVYAFTLTDRDAIKDVAVAHVAYNGFAFLMNATSLEATVRVHGYGTGSLTVRLSENGREIANEVVDLVPGERDYVVEFPFVPKTLGKQVFGVRADPLNDEVYAGNNEKQVIVNVIRDKVRVLQIVGQPSWDQRFLRDLLKSDPDIDLISFFILVNPQGGTMTRSARETALIPFPAQELFEQELGGFDLAIFQNFNYGPFRTRQYLPAIARYVEEGGAFLMVGGQLSLSAGGYYGTPIVDVLPVEIPPRALDDPRIDPEPFQGALTEAGRTHPITRLAQDPATNAEVWAEREPLEGVNLVSSTRDDALVLLEHPKLKDEDGEPVPVVAIREPGEGRSMVVTTDSTWHWSFKAGMEGREHHHYDTFWSNAVRWLIKDPELDLIKVDVLRESVPVGEAARARIEVFQPDYKPAAQQPVELVVRRRGPDDGPGEGEVILEKAGLVTDAEGAAEVQVPVERAGIYEVEARSVIVEGREARGTELFVGTDVNPEFEVVVGDGRLLGLLAEASDGAVLPLQAEDAPRLTLREPRITKVASRRQRDLWNVPFVFVALIGLFGAEWWLRRRFGFL